MVTAMEPLPIFDPAAAWTEYDAAARALPACVHNAAWWRAGPGRGMPPDCAENRAHRAAVGALRAVFRAASANAEVHGG